LLECMRLTKTNVRCKTAEERADSQLPRYKVKRGTENLKLSLARADSRCMISSERSGDKVERGPRLAPPSERRRHHRVKVSLPVRIRGGVGTTDPFEDMVTTTDVARGGLLIETGRGGYYVGQALEVTYPYSSDTDSINTPKRATVVRATTSSAFYFAIALRIDNGPVDQPLENREKLPSGAHRVAGSVHVLIVDSDIAEGEKLRAMLEEDGYHVASVVSAHDAFDVIKSQTPDVIVAEVECGEPSGHDLCAIVKKSERHQHIPVILLMRSAAPADYSTSHELGAVVCLAKPFKPDRLRHVVHLVAPPPTQRSAYSAQFNISSFVRTE
jgi:CheY-like chemotaxis protein